MSAVKTLIMLSYKQSFLCEISTSCLAEKEKLKDLKLELCWVLSSFLVFVGPVGRSLPNNVAKTFLCSVVKGQSKGHLHMVVCPFR